MTPIFNPITFHEKCRLLRNQLHPAERALWSYLRREQVDYRKFRRQQSVGPYILDFYCPALKLAVELDGVNPGSAAAQNYAAKRQRYAEALNIHFMRFTNAEVMENLAGVILAIVTVAQMEGETVRARRL